MVLNGLRPNLSSLAPIIFPSPNITAAGPSFFSSNNEKYSNIDIMSSDKLLSFSHAGGIIEITAETMSNSSSKILFCKV